MSEQGWRQFLAAEGVDDWVVLHGGASAVFSVASLGAAARHSPQEDAWWTNPVPLRTGYSATAPATACASAPGPTAPRRLRPVIRSVRAQRARHHVPVG
jgi:hypothetical protein